ncbi:MAG TPA: hypothetical protein PKM21_02085 [Anaerolineales bacterium]|nr:hypothetical protein [Anaerolineales bacterium]
MREWDLKANDPLSMVLAADARFGPTDYCNDQIWELKLGGGEPPALAVQTTFGLRARSLRIFPRFSEADTTLSDPDQFARPISVHSLYPNYARLSYAPFSDIDVENEFWVPNLPAIAGRMRLTNHSATPRSIGLEYTALLMPASNAGQRMSPAEIELTPVLTGKTGSLAPLFYVSEGAQPSSGPYTGLTISLDLQPGESRQVSWALSAGEDSQEQNTAAFERGRSLAMRNWDALRARIELSNASMLEIHTGDPGWDTAFFLAQKVALGLFLHPLRGLDRPSFVSNRLPDQGYSMRGDGSDYNHLWNGQTPLEAHYLASLVLPSAPQLVQGILFNFLEQQAEDGTVDWKPGLGGQRGQLNAPPLLASLAWQIYLATGERAFLEQTFAGLLRFLQSWFRPEFDRDGDGIPEWSHAMQTGFDDHPLFAHWHEWSQGLDITTVESPDLCAYLYRECEALIDIARLLGQEQHVDDLQAKAAALQSAVDAAWNEKSACYQYWDRDAHVSTNRQELGTRQGPGEIRIAEEFSQPVRLLFKIRLSGEGQRAVQVFIHGSGSSGGHRIERLAAERMRRWPASDDTSIGCLTSERTYTSIEHIGLEGIQPEDQVFVYTAEHSLPDHTVLLPLWAGIPDAERARTLIKQTITSAKHFWGTYGLRSCFDPASKDKKNPSPAAEACSGIYLPWNALVGAGLVRYGQRAKAAELLTRIMKAITQTLKRDQAFRRYYDDKTGYGQGEVNAAAGLAPLGLFLDVLGVRIISPHCVTISGSNPFPWPVTVKYRGLTVLRQKKKTMIIFPDGQNITVKNDPSSNTTRWQTIRLE